MNTFIPLIIEFVLIVVVFLVVRYIPALNITKMTQEDLIPYLSSWAYKLVVSAKNQMTSQTGSDKLKYVTSEVEALCKKYNIELSEELVRAIVEDAYDKMKINVSSVVGNDKKESESK